MANQGPKRNRDPPNDQEVPPPPSRPPQWNLLIFLDFKKVFMDAYNNWVPYHIQSAVLHFLQENAVSASSIY